MISAGRWNERRLSFDGLIWQMQSSEKRVEANKETPEVRKNLGKTQGKSRKKVEIVVIVCKEEDLVTAMEAS